MKRKADAEAIVLTGLSFVVAGLLLAGSELVELPRITRLPYISWTVGLSVLLWLAVPLWVGTLARGGKRG